MNLSTSLRVASVCCFLALTIIFVADAQTTIPSTQAPPEAGSEGLGDDDPKAREYFEWLRLHDPATGKIPDEIRQKELEFARGLPTKESLARARKDAGLSPDAGQVVTWNARGPKNVGGRTRALAIDVSNPNIMLAGGVSGGMWRSTNAGATWQKQTDVGALQSVTCIAQDRRPGSTNVWYYGTGEWRGNSASLSQNHNDNYRGDGIFKSVDNGVTWAQLPSTVSGTPHSFDKVYDYVWNIVTDSSNPSQAELYAATYGGIRRSTDGGASWSNVLGGGLTSSSASTYADVAITSSGIVYAALSQNNSAGSSAATRGIWRSTNGTTWVSISPAALPLSYSRIVLGIARSNENVVFALADTPFSGSLETGLYMYTYISGDGSGAGGSWSNRTANLPAYGAPVGDYDSQGSYDMMVVVKPDNENVVFIGGTNLYRSTDGFSSTANTTWIGGYSPANNVSRYPSHHPDQHGVVFDATTPTTMYSYNDGGVQRTTDNLAGVVSWTSLNNGYITSQFYTIALDHGTPGDNVVTGGLQDNGTWFTNNTNPATSWVSTRGGDGAFCAIADGRTSYYQSSQSGNTYRYLLTASGAQTGFTRVDPTGGSGYAFINPFVLDPNNTDIMYMSVGSTVWRNSDLTAIPLLSNSTTAVNWSALSNTSAGGGSVSALGVSKVTANRLYYGRSNGLVHRVDGANVGNPATTNITGVGFPGGAYPACVAVDPTNADRVIVVFSNYNVQSLFYSENGGTSWTAISGNLEEVPNGSSGGPSCRWASFLPGAGVFVGTSTGLYSTAVLNGTSTVWALEGSSNIGNVVVDAVDTRQSDGTIVIGTHGNGVYSATVPPSAPSSPTLLTPSDLAVNQLISPMLTWVPTPLATSYRCQLSVDSLFGSFIIDDSTLTTASRSVAGLANKSTYYWRVNAKNSLGTSSFSAFRAFTTIVDTPAVPVPLLPLDAAVHQSVSPTIVWSSVVDAATYRLQLSTDSLFTTFVVNDSTITDTTATVGPLANATVYYWRVRAKNAGGTSLASARSSFKTILAVPLLVLPLDGVTYQQLSLRFVWRPVGGATAYHLQISDNALFTTPLHDDSLVADTTSVVGSLTSASTLYWRVTGRDGVGDGPWSGSRTLSTISSVPAVPLLVSPPDSTGETAFTLQLTWSSSLGTTFYVLEVDSNELFTAPSVADSTLTDTTSMIGPLEPNTKYHWRVRAKNDLGSSAWSVSRQFTTFNQRIAAIPVQAGWNLMSLPYFVSDYRRVAVFPQAISSAFTFTGAYTERDTIALGTGYWLNYGTSQTVNVTGIPLEMDSVSVVTGWNMVGSIGTPVPVGSISSNPGGIVMTNFYGYDTGYSLADTIDPFRGYWVKVSLAGKLVLTTQGPEKHQAMKDELSSLNRLTFTDARGYAQSLYFGRGLSQTTRDRYELPPFGPDGAKDVRFSSQRMIESVDGSSETVLPILIRGVVYPVKVSWELTDRDVHGAFVAGVREVSLNASTGVELSEPGNALSLRIEKLSQIPSAFALDQNYPNPFNPSTYISYGVPYDVHVRLSVYNLLGEEVARLVNVVTPAGTYRVRFNAESLPGGVYYYRLSAGDVSLVRKLLLVK